LSLEGLLTLIGIVVAVYALAQPIQRRSVPLFVPIWLVILSIIISAGLLIWRYAVPTFCYQVYPWSDFASMVGAFFFPIIGLLTAYVFWHRAKLKKKKDTKFQRFIFASYYEDKFDELMRILEKNEESLHDVLKPETLDLLFERKFVKRMVDARKWIHLRLFSNNNLVEKLPDRFKVTDNIIRELVDAKTSPLHSAIVSDYGGSKYLRPTKEEWELIEKTLKNPEWYMSVRIDYALTVLACCEVLASGKLDKPYNQNDEWYIARQGESTRLRCPVYLALKTHVIMLKKAIENEGEDDYYVSDLWDLFRNVCEHSQYDEDVWENKDANSEYPTPFAFLMKEIFLDLRYLCRERERHRQNIRPPGRIGNDLIRTWATCVAHLGYSRDKVSDKFKYELVRYYLIHALEMMEAYEDADEEEKEYIKLWRDGLVEKLKWWRRGDNRLREVLFQSMNGVDLGKSYSDYEDWLRSELELPDRPRPAN